MGLGHGAGRQHLPQATMPEPLHVYTRRGDKAWLELGYTVLHVDVVYHAPSKTRLHIIHRWGLHATLIVRTRVKVVRMAGLCGPHAPPLPPDARRPAGIMPWRNAQPQLTSAGSFYGCTQQLLLKMLKKGKLWAGLRRTSARIATLSSVVRFTSPSAVDMRAVEVNSCGILH